jgi:hypothetical protein
MITIVCSKHEHTANLQLLGADYTVEFFVLVIRWAGKMAMAACCFNVMEKDTISVAYAVG